MSPSDAGRPFRRLPHSVDTPARNLAIDQALLESSREGLRFYGWDPPGLSLGYFQSLQDSWVEEAGRRGFEVVRRPTGGGAIAHRDELTFALADEVGQGVFGPSPREDVERLHRAFVRGLARVGVRAGLRGEVAAASDRADRAWMCFLKSSDLDLVVEGRKLLGSAARRARGRVMIHGSLPLRRNLWTPEAISVEECLGRAPEVDEVAAALAEELAREYGLVWVDGALDAEESGRAEELVRTRYGMADWTRRR